MTPNDAQRTPWPQNDLRHFERRLVEERERAVAESGRMSDANRTSLEDATGELTTQRLHMADIGTETFEQEQNMMFASREGQLVQQIDDALRRLYKTPEAFGMCTDCGQRIARERLDAIPHVATCVQCKQTWEGSSADRPAAEA